jgi:hypothetical protein
VSEDGGQKFDDDKTRMELLPPRALERISDVLTFGAKKYDDRNWELGLKYSRLFGAFMRHMWAWWRGENKDPETGLSHLAHAGCCLLMMLEFEELEYDDLDDRPSERTRSESENIVVNDSGILPCDGVDSDGRHTTSGSAATIACSNCRRVRLDDQPCFFCGEV